MNLTKKLIIEQIDKNLQYFYPMLRGEQPVRGWINYLRTGLNMSLAQLAKKMNITAASLSGIEQREQTKNITLKKLSDAAEAMNCRLIYAIIPKDGSLEKLIEKRALEAAKEIVLRTSHSMKLEDQENSSERIQKAIKDRAELIKHEMPKYLWD